MKLFKKLFRLTKSSKKNNKWNKLAPKKGFFVNRPLRWWFFPLGTALCAAGVFVLGWYILQNRYGFSEGDKASATFVVVENMELRREITKIQPYCASLPTASLGIVVCGVPEALPNAPAEGFWPQDCAAATENILLQAAELGYGTCWCGVYPDAARVAAIRKLLNLQKTPFNLIIVGVPDESPAQRGYYDRARVKYLR